MDLPGINDLLETLHFTIKYGDRSLLVPCGTAVTKTSLGMLFGTEVTYLTHKESGREVVDLPDDDGRFQLETNVTYTVTSVSPSPNPATTFASPLMPLRQQFTQHLNPSSPFMNHSANSTTLKKKPKTYVKQVSVMQYSAQLKTPIHIETRRLNLENNTTLESILEQLGGDSKVITDSKYMRITELAPEVLRTPAMKLCVFNVQDYEDYRRFKARASQRKRSAADAELDSVKELVEELKEEWTELKTDLKNILQTRSNLEEFVKCKICLATMNQPQFTECCEILVGCKRCVDEWSTSNGTCPHCRAHGFITKTVKGF